MPSTRDKYEPWLRDYIRKRYPDLEAPILAAVDAFDRIKNDPRADELMLLPIVEAASSSRVPLYSNATELLSELTATHEIARATIVRMAGNAQSHVRVNAIHCLGPSTPRDFTLSVIRVALEDRSSQVREMAAVLAGKLQLRELASELDFAFVRETNRLAKKGIERELKLLRDGYIIEPDTDGTWNVTTRCANGIVSKTVFQSELDRRGIDAIVAELAIL